MVEKVLEDEYFILFINKQKVITNTWKIMINKESSFIQCWDVNNLHVSEMLRKLRINNFECIQDTSQFNENL